MFRVDRIHATNFLECKDWVKHLRSANFCGAMYVGPPDDKEQLAEIAKSPRQVASACAQSNLILRNEYFEVTERVPLIIGFSALCRSKLKLLQMERFLRKCFRETAFAVLGGG